MFKSCISEVRNNQKLKPQATLLDSDLEDENRSLRRMRECKVCLSAEVKIITLYFTFEMSPFLFFARFGSCNFAMHFHLLFYISLSLLYTNFKVYTIDRLAWSLRPIALLLFTFTFHFPFTLEWYFYCVAI